MTNDRREGAGLRAGSIPEVPQPGRETEVPEALDPRTLRLARLALFWEKLWPAAWPAVGVVGLFAALAFVGFFALLPGWLHLLLLLGFGLALGGSAYRLAHVLSLPSVAAAERRIERDSALAHRPLTAL